MDAGLYFTLVSLLFTAISISILDIIFTLVSVGFLNPFKDFDSALNCQLHVCASRIEVPDNIHVTIGWRKTGTLL